MCSSVDTVVMFRCQAERARKNAENELNETSSHVSELKITIATLTTDKRRMEADISAMQADLDEALNARRSAEERADRLQVSASTSYASSYLNPQQ